MAEENQNAEMEDILSSIKNILEENETAQFQNGDRQAPVPDVAPEVSAENDDILELSPEMRSEPEPVNDTVIVPSETESVDMSAAYGVSSDNTSDNAGQDENILSFENDISLEEFEKSPDEVSLEPVSVFPETESGADTFDVVDDLINTPQNGVDELISETVNIPDTEEPGLASLAEEAGLETAAEPLMENAQPVEVWASFEPEPVAAALQDTMVQVANEPAEDSSVSLPEAEQAGTEPETEPVFASPATDKTADEDAVDVSAGIISNFAKMFAKEEHHKEIEKEEPVKITAVGDAGKTLEEFVLESVGKVIGGEIKRQWNNGEAFNALAEAEIKRQTQNWINDNLPALVEKIVKQEIERVIAKVGS